MSIRSISTAMSGPSHFDAGPAAEPDDPADDLLITAESLDREEAVANWNASRESAAVADAAEREDHIADLRQIIKGYDAHRAELEQALQGRICDVIIREARIKELETMLAVETGYRKQADVSLAAAEAARDAAENELAATREALAEQALIAGEALAAARRRERRDAERHACNGASIQS